MMTCGIDPGVTGAIAFIGDGLIDVFDLPIADGNIDGEQLAHLLGQWQPDSIWVEKTHAMPKNGGLANFSSGYSQGAICGVVQAMGYSSLHRVLPTAWKKTQGLTGKDKESSRALARDLFPDVRIKLTNKKDHNRAEALLIARHGIFNFIHGVNA